MGVKFVVMGSYAMRHLRPTHDLDITVDPSDWDKLTKSGLGELDRAPMSGNPRYLVTSSDIPEIEFFYTSYPKGYEYRALAPEGYDKDRHGNQVWTRDQLIRWKKEFGRPKDLRDIAMLEKSGSSMNKIASKLMLASFLESISSDAEKLAKFQVGNTPKLNRRLTPFRNDISKKLKPKFTIEAPAKNVVSTGKADSGGLSAATGGNSSGGGAP